MIWEWLMYGTGAFLILMGPVVLFIIAYWMRRSGNGNSPTS
jgi:hypothetical protein